jgi:hypothetical protein
MSSVSTNSTFGFAVPVPGVGSVTVPLGAREAPAVWPDEDEHEPATTARTAAMATRWILMPPVLRRAMDLRVSER